jgi:hypothetical protein
MVYHKVIKVRRVDHVFDQGDKRIGLERFGQIDHHGLFIFDEVTVVRNSLPGYRPEALKQVGGPIVQTDTEDVFFNLIHNHIYPSFLP